MTPAPGDGTPGILAAIAAEAGCMLAGVRDRSAGHVIKPDGTPATRADTEAERLIEARLAEAFPGIPVVAEESARTAEGEWFFVVDPLDGTRDYLTGAGEYSVNIALVRGDRPVAAALASPPLGRVWAAGTRAQEAALDTTGGIGPWRDIRVRSAPAEGLVALTSRRHGDEATESCLGALPVAARRTASSAVKFGLIASGEADLYLRCGPTCEWDTAAGDHILTRAGGTVICPAGKPLRYGRAAEAYLNGPFAALGDPALVSRIALPAVAPVSSRRAPA